MTTTNKPLKKIPVFDSDAELEAFVDNADLSEYDLSSFKHVDFSFPEKARLNMRMSVNELERVKKSAARKGVSYQSYIRDVLAKAVAEDEKTREKAGSE
jgi:predicted DNA binding CopG/RHH family protein